MVARTRRSWWPIAVSMDTALDVRPSDLPFLILHGRWMWIPITLGLVIVSLATHYCIRALIARIGAQRARSRQQWVTRMGGEPPRFVRPRATPLFEKASLVWACLFFALWTFVLRVQARSYYEKHYSMHSWELQFAAAMPNTRAKVLARLRTYDGVTSFAELRERLAIAIATGDCPAEMLASAGLHEEAAAWALRCDSKELAVAQLVDAGLYAAANAIELSTPTHESLLAAVGASDWRKATTIAGASSCLGALFAHYAGDHDSFARVWQWEENPRCRVIEALTHPPADMLERLHIAMRDDESLVAFKLGLSAGIRIFQPWIANAWFDSQAGASTWFAALHTGALHGCEATPSHLARGDREAARDGLADCARLRQENDELQIELSTRHPELRDLSYAAAYDAAHPFGDDRCDALESELRSATSIAAEMLLDYVDRCSDDPETWAYFLPKTNITNRVRDAIRWRHQTRYRSGRQFPFEQIDEHAWTRDVARIAGDESYAVQLDAIVQRHATALADARRISAFLLLANN